MENMETMQPVFTRKVLESARREMEGEMHKLLREGLPPRMVSMSERFLDAQDAAMCAGAQWSLFSRSQTSC